MNVSPGIKKAPSVLMAPRGKFGGEETSICAITGAPDGTGRAHGNASRIGAHRVNVEAE